MPRDIDFEVTARCPQCGNKNIVSINMLEAGMELCNRCDAPLPDDSTLILDKPSGSRSPS